MSFRRDKQAIKLKKEAKEKDDRIKELLEVKVAEIKSEHLDSMKLALMRQYADVNSSSYRFF